MLVPGLGQLYAGARRRGLLLLGAHGALLLVVVLAARIWLPAIVTIDRRLVAPLLALDLALLAFRLFAVVDAVARRRRRRPGVCSRCSPRAAARRGRLRDRPRLRACSRPSSPTRSRRTSCPRAGSSSPRAAAAAARRVPDDSWELGARRAARARRDGAARALGPTCSPDADAGGAEAVDDDPAARHRRGPRQLGRAHRHDHPRRRPARHRPGGRVRRPAQPRPGAGRREAEAASGSR